MASRTKPASQQSVFRLRVQLKDVEPEVWRQIQVAGSLRMGQLSDVLLAALGWANSHLHAFLVGETRIRTLDDDDSEEDVDENEATVLEALRGEAHFLFEYDFGDGWEHNVTIEDLSFSDVDLRFSVCLDGENSCPPEDVGGPRGYLEFRERVGGQFDPSEFNLAATNARLQKLR